MARTNYQRGRDFEYRTRNYLLRKQGAAYVMRAAQSKGVFDLIALFGVENPGTVVETVPHVMLIQCKRDGRLAHHEKMECLKVARACGQAAYLAKAGPNGRGVIFERLTEE